MYEEGRKEGRKEERKEGRKEENQVYIINIPGVKTKQLKRLIN